MKHVLFLKVLYSHVGHSEFSVLTHIIPGKIISEKHIYVMFVEHAVAVNRLYCQLLLTYEMLPSGNDG